MNIFNELNELGVEDKVGTTYDEIETYLEQQGYNMVELGKVLREQGNQQIVTGAGSGKTTAIILKTLADLKTGNSSKQIQSKGMTTEVSDRIWISTFLKSGADDLERTLNKKKLEMNINVDTSSIKFSTIHAEFKHVLNSMGIQTNILTLSSALKILREVAKDFGLGSNKGYPTNEELASVMSYLSAARNKLKPETFYHSEMEDVGLTSDNLMYVIKRYQQLREKYRVVDFEDLQELLFRYACNEQTRNVNVTNYIANRFDKIIIDEFQDVSEIQYEILKVYARGVKSIVVVGDDDQSIYSWRGSNVDIITKHFQQDFDPVVNNLSVNYRCPSNILNPAVKSIVRNENRYDKTLKSANEGGDMACYGYETTIEMARSVQDQIIEDVKKGYSVAVLGRTNGGLLPLSIYLDFQNHFKYAIRGTLYDLDRVKFKRYWRLAHLFMGSNDFLADNLRVLTPSEPRYKINNFSNALKTEGYTVFNFSRNLLRNMFPDLADYADAVDSLGDVTPLEMLRFTFEYLKAQQVSPSGVLLSEELVSIFEILIMIIDESKCQTVNEFLSEINYRNTRLHGHADSKDLTIQLTTVHDFKGKEADSVYIWKDTNKMFPSERSVEEDFEEERRVHYIASTRAKKKSTILTITGQESPFIHEMGLKPVKRIGNVSNHHLNKTKTFNTANMMLDGMFGEQDED